MILYVGQHVYCTVPENIHTPPTEGIGIFWGWGFCKAYKFKEMYEDELEFPTGWVVLTKRPFLGGGMDIFWYTFLIL